MAIDINNVTETIRINKNSINIKVLIASGKEGNHFIVLSPSTNVSGYGRTKKESEESFDANMNLFLEDLMKLPK
jgi:hypothetical protein